MTDSKESTIKNIQYSLSVDKKDAIDVINSIINDLQEMRNGLSSNEHVRAKDFQYIARDLGAVTVLASEISTKKDALLMIEKITEAKS